MYKKYVFPIFILIAFIQLAIPVKSIYDQEQILAHGKEFKFRTAPVDPNDPFRGKYVALRFKENTINVALYEKWKQGDKIYAHIDEDKNGFAQLTYASKTEPTRHKHYIVAKIQRVKTSMDEKNNITNIEISIQYPFDRFYMEESKAKAAEDLYRKSTADQKKITYALVNVNKGKATLKDVMIDGVSIQKLVEMTNQN